MWVPQPAPSYDEESAIEVTQRRLNTKKIYRRVSQATKRFFGRTWKPASFDWESEQYAPSDTPETASPFATAPLSALFRDLVHPARLLLFELFPALLASLPDVAPIPSLELLFDQPESADDFWSPCPSTEPARDAHAVSLEIAARTRFPILRTLRLGPRDVDSAARTVLSAQDMAALIEKLGCQTPLQNIAICRGVQVDDSGALKCLYGQRGPNVLATPVLEKPERSRNAGPIGLPTTMVDCAPLATLGDKPFIPPDMTDELNATVTSLFERAIRASDASSSIINAVMAALARPMRDRLPAELWLAVWIRLPLHGRVAASHRVKGMKLIVGFCLDRDIEDFYLLRFVDILAPQADNIAVITLSCAIHQSQIILDRIQPLSSIQALVQSATPPDPRVPVLHPAFAWPAVLPDLKLLILPHLPLYGFPDFLHDLDGPSLPMQARFPTLKRFCFAPEQDSDIPTLVFGQATHLYLLEVLPEQLDWALQTFRMPQRPFIHVTIMDDLPETLLPPDAYVPPANAHENWPPRPNFTAPSYADPPTGGTRRRLTTRQIYRRVAGATRRIFGKKATSPRSTDPCETSTTITETPCPPVPRGLDTLSTLFRDIGQPVNVLLVCQTVCDSWGAGYAGASLKATDCDGHSRAAGLRYRANLSQFLAHVWESDLPLNRVAHLASDYDLLPALLASLPDETSVPSLELLFARTWEQRARCDDLGSPDAAIREARLDISGCTRFPDLRTLRLGPRGFDSAVRTVLSAKDIASFLAQLGCKTPLENITLCRGVHIDDAGALEGLARSVFLAADPAYWRPYS
ncbi:hypothetical protein AURDEDRAFT_151996 [Auricularia subglabra TFB-10046 SS5]|nr:hypothetical protein AURDEDRAFT_151996 [Auricularia subglabra TFB-10046 SS5]